MNDVAAASEVYQFRAVLRDSSPHVWHRIGNLKMILVSILQKLAPIIFRFLLARHYAVGHNETS